jgi:transposase-like protein
LTSLRDAAKPDYLTEALRREIAVPHDRQASFKPQLIAKYPPLLRRFRRQGDLAQR